MTTVRVKELGKSIVLGDAGNLFDEEDRCGLIGLSFGPCAERKVKGDKLGKGVDSDGFLGVQNCSRINRWFRHSAVGIEHDLSQN